VTNIFNQGCEFMPAGTPGCCVAFNGPGGGPKINCTPPVQK